MSYPTDISDAQWEKTKAFFEQKRKFGRPLLYDRRIIVNAIFYITKAGCQWRMLPKDFPHWATVYYYFKKWSEEGIWEQILDLLNIQSRMQQEKKPNPSLWIIDSQSVKTQYKSDERGFDGGKKNQRAKTPHYLLHVKVHAANIHDTKAAPTILNTVKRKESSLEIFSADAGYRGTTADHIEENMKLAIVISKKNKDGWAILSKILA